jgi:hypothetical protein
MRFWVRAPVRLIALDSSCLTVHHVRIDYKSSQYEQKTSPGAKSPMQGIRGRMRVSRRTLGGVHFLRDAITLTRLLPQVSVPPIILPVILDEVPAAVAQQLRPVVRALFATAAQTTTLIDVTSASSVSNDHQDAHTGIAFEAHHG